MSGPEYVDLRFRTEAELARKGALQRVWRSPPSIASSTLKFGGPRPEISVYDGRKTVSFNNQRLASINGQPARDTYLVSSNEDVGAGYGDPWLQSGDDLLMAMLSGYEKKSPENRAKELAEQEETGAAGEAVLRITVVYPRTNGKDIAWLLRDHDFLVTRFERHMGGTLRFGSRTESFGDLHGIWFPKEVTRSDFSKDGKLLRELKITVLSATDDPQQIPDSLFKLEIPDGAAVYDKDLDRLLMDPKDVED
ncbi:MAG TPA: hypothetical protein VND64_21280, partial [Pirellulales bacterium]|nr:hypothetical protein [Pirellulales bacterium]